MKAAYTIITLNYLAQAKTTAVSFLSFHPDYKFFICLIGDKKDIPDPNFLEGLTIHDTITSHLSGYEDMRSRYTDFELSCALKPFFCEYLLNQYSPDIIFYLDSDLLFFNALTGSEEVLSNKSILLTPHIMNSGRGADEDEMDIQFLTYGLYNGGFFGIRRTPEAVQFINWWKQKLFTACYSNISIGQYVDQLWLNLVPIFFKDVVISRDKGLNVAVWNLSERKLTWNAAAYWVNNESPLIFYHFSSYKHTTPEVLSNNHPYFTFLTRPDVKPLFDLYTSLLSKNEIDYYQSLVVPPRKKTVSWRKKLGDFIRKVLIKLGL